eukprot:TRINITY_DN497_c2_g7_i1.p1 TRINITY_DN497_c2_g7~~TRINITY_DN497_c2_g7_i1.p1  ORF type:complete len:780 (-),score=402.94 TRINITY_DN497_c2_g7_i1:105-2444(-)
MSQLDQLIPLINRLQDVFTTLNCQPVDLPQIVVVGSQSSGKSSVLEAICGKDFLPRGSGIVTRRPLVLQLIQRLDLKGKNPEEYAEFLHDSSKKWSNFSEVRSEIEKETDRITGKNKGISREPIGLKIFSPKVINLTLVDLPGITRVPVGDQPKDIEQQIRAMVLEYITRPNSVILAVTAANTDLSNSDALQLAKEVDPQGIRTLGVITKIDIMDKGTDALDVLLGRIIPLQLGFVGVVNRSQADINTRKKIDDALSEEANFFRTNPIYNQISGRCGTPFLAKRLNEILINHIKATLPALRNRVQTMLSDAQKELSELGEGIPGGNKGATILSLITKIANDYCNAIDGKSTQLSMNELQGGARINNIFISTFPVDIDLIRADDAYSLVEIRTAIRNATGPRTALFVPEESFETLVKNQIQRLEDPTLRCVESVYDELRNIFIRMDCKEFRRFYGLRIAVTETFERLLNDLKIPTREFVLNFIKMELAYINTTHPEFIGGAQALTRVVEQLQALAQAENSETNQNQNFNMNQSNYQPMNQSVQATYQPNQSVQINANANSNVNRQPSPSTPNVLNQPQPSQQNPLNNPNQNPNQNLNGQQNQQKSGAFFGNFFGKQPTPGTASPSPSSSQAKSMPPVPPKKQAPPIPNQPSPQVQQYQETRQNNLTVNYNPQVSSTLGPITEREKFEVTLILELVLSYFSIVKKNIKDLIPKSIMFFLVNKSKERIQNELVADIYAKSNPDDLLKESPEIAARRSELEKLYQALTKASTILAEVRDLNFR